MYRLAVLTAIATRLDYYTKSKSILSLQSQSQDSFYRQIMINSQEREAKEAKTKPAGTPSGATGSGISGAGTSTGAAGRSGAAASSRSNIAPGLADLSDDNALLRDVSYVKIIVVLVCSVQNVIIL